MSNELTPEKVMEIGEKWLDMILASLPSEKVLQYVSPEERLSGLRAEEVLEHFRPEERLQGLKPEEIEAYLQKLKKQNKLGNGDRQVEG